MRFLLLASFSAALVCAQAPGVVKFSGLPAPQKTGKPAKPCSELRSLTNYEISVVRASIVGATEAVPEHCRVSLFIQPELNIEVNLPTAWNGRLYMFGNGGWAGESFESAGRVATRGRGLKAGFVTAATDTGHSAAVDAGASFALNRQKLLDFGFRSLHLTAETAKMLAKVYYGAGPAKSYYEGCSQGGRQGLTLAQRFPNDFDGIVAGAPALFQTGTHMARAYWMKGQNENPFPAAKAGLLAKLVYDYCDAKDGLKDGLIDDPRRCDFKPSVNLPKCAAGADKADCFTADQIRSAELIYGDVMSQGKRFFPGWPLGAEGGWVGQEVPNASGSSAWSFYGSQFLHFIAPMAKGGHYDADPATAFKQFDIDKDPQRLEDLHNIMDANDSDLSAFKRHGGKLLLYYGWADPQLNARMGVEYYEQVQQTMGASTDEFARLFMVPGMYHCSGGVGTNQFDMAVPLVKWVEAGAAPVRIESGRVEQGKVVRTRPLCSYPQVSRYKGSGSIDEAANFSCVNP